MPSRYRGHPDEVRALETFVKLLRAGEGVSGRLSHALAEHDLTLGQLGVLEALFHLGPMNQRELSRKLLRSSSNVCTVLDNLEAAGLVRRERSSEDRRVTNISLTDKGRERIERVFPQHAADITSLFSVLTPDEQDTLGALCKKLGTAIV
jgi:MarR family transcriptional regulator, 2-MHQ and catechol-resistance regulon repressor